MASDVQSFLVSVLVVLVALVIGLICLIIHVVRKPGMPDWHESETPSAGLGFGAPVFSAPVCEDMPAAGKPPVVFEEAPLYLDPETGGPMAGAPDRPE